MAGRSSWREASTELVVSSETMRIAVSDRPVIRHSHKISWVQARAQPGAVGSAPRSSIARSGQPAGTAGCGGSGQGCTVSSLVAVMAAMDRLRCVRAVFRPAWLATGRAAVPSRLAGAGRELSVMRWPAAGQARCRAGAGVVSGGGMPGCAGRGGRGRCCRACRQPRCGRGFAFVPQFEERGTGLLIGAVIGRTRRPGSLALPRPRHLEGRGARCDPAIRSILTGSAAFGCHGS
jgi:hypothetical protein